MEEKRVLWIADFGLKHNQGGAQRTNQYMIAEAKARGHEIVEFNHDSHPKLLKESYDIVVSNNLEHLSQKREIIDFICKHPYHIRYEHDANSYLSQQDRKDLFGSAKRTVFLSQYHYIMFKELYGNIFVGNIVSISPPIDTNKFKDKRQPRENKTLYVGLLHVLKGTNNFFNYVLNNPDQQFVMAAWGSPRFERFAKTFKNIEWLGQVPYERMPDLYNKYERLYYHPEKFEPFCRSIGEALFCGMDINASDNIGAVHDSKQYDLRQMKERAERAPVDFWEGVLDDNGNS